MRKFYDAKLEIKGEHIKPYYHLVIKGPFGKGVETEPEVYDTDLDVAADRKSARAYFTHLITDNATELELTWEAEIIDPCDGRVIYKMPSLSQKTVTLSTSLRFEHERPDIIEIRGFQGEFEKLGGKFDNFMSGFNTAASEQRATMADSGKALAEAVVNASAAQVSSNAAVATQLDSAVKDHTTRLMENDTRNTHFMVGKGEDIREATLLTAERVGHLTVHMERMAPFMEMLDRRVLSMESSQAAVTEMVQTLAVRQEEVVRQVAMFEEAIARTTVRNAKTKEEGK